MSAHDRIDLDAIKQAFFKGVPSNFVENAYFWMIVDQKNNLISCSSSESLNSIQTSIKLHDTSKIFSTELIKIKTYSVVIPVNIYEFYFSVNNDNFIVKMYIENTSLNIKFKLFYFNYFDRVDKIGNILCFTNIVRQLKIINPLELLSAKEWLITWLLINRYKNNDIATITNNKTNTINKAVDRISGPKKLAIFDRYMLSDVALYLNWDRFIPIFLISSLLKTNKLNLSTSDTTHSKV